MNKRNKKYWITGIVVFIIIIFSLIYFDYIGMFGGHLGNPTRIIGPEGARIDGCKMYQQQVPYCSDWSKISVNWQGENVSFKDFLASNYNCSNENCAKIICDCQ